jgi:cobalamin-dependent methionine synthase I
MKPLDVQSIEPWLNKKMLFHALWQITAESLQNDSELRAELDEKYRQMLLWAKEIVELKYKYTFIYGEHEDNKLKLFNSQQEVITTVTFHPQISIPKARFPIQVVTLGQSAVDKANTLRNNGEYQDYFFWHGFCAAMTEALASFVHAFIRVETGLEKEEEQSPIREFSKNYPGSRISFGYEVLPNIMEQKTILEILNATEIGISTTESGMLEPEYSTCALIILLTNKHEYRK